MSPRKSKRPSLRKACNALLYSKFRRIFGAQWISFYPLSKPFAPPLPEKFLICSVYNDPWMSASCLDFYVWLIWPSMGKKQLFLLNFKLLSDAFRDSAYRTLGTLILHSARSFPSKGRLLCLPGAILYICISFFSTMCHQNRHLRTKKRPFESKFNPTSSFLISFDLSLFCVRIRRMTFKTSSCRWSLFNACNTITQFHLVIVFVDWERRCLF